MLRHISLAEDLALKRLVTTPLDQKPGFAWRDALGDPSLEAALPEVIVTRGNRDERQFNLADVADEIGAALTDLLLSRAGEGYFHRGESRIRRRTSRIPSPHVSSTTSARVTASSLSDYDLSLLIEKALIENDAHDVAKSLVFKRSVKETPARVTNRERSRRLRRPSPSA